jgi:hypothetical protein
MPTLLLLHREVFLDGLYYNIATAHSVLLCFFVGPIGLLSHAITKALAHKPQATKQRTA